MSLIQLVLPIAAGLLPAIVLQALVSPLDFNKVRRFDIEDGDSPNVVIEGAGWMCKQGACQDNVKIAISAPRQEALARAIESKRHAIDFIKKACPGLPRDR